MKSSHLLLIFLGLFSFSNQTEVTINGDENDPAAIVLQQAQDGIKIQYKDKIFSIETQKGIQIISTVPENNAFQLSGDVQIEGKLELVGDTRLIINSVPQWKLIDQEIFEYGTPAYGWTNTSITQCGSFTMLGGYCRFGGGETQKTFKDLPPHNEINIIASYHFLDRWTGESGFLRVSIQDKMEYVWVDRYDSTIVRNAINVCGAQYGEGRFSEVINVVLKHQKSSITVGFGSTLDQDPCEASFGISNMQIYVR